METMTKDELKTLREKHRWQMNNEGDDRCTGCFSYEYPCDVIKVLDATENLKFNDLKTEVDCDHRIETLKGKKKNAKAWFGFPYCPKCGEKL